MEREFKDSLYNQFARIGHAVSTPKRIELLDLLSQGERSVEKLAELSNTPIKNTSAHLRALRHARLVETRRDGTYVLYRLADDDVARFLQELQTLGRSRLAEVEQVTTAYLTGRDELDPVTLDELRRLMRDDKVVVLDVRPREEFEAAHIPGAVSIPVEQLNRRLKELPTSRTIVAYCRGPYCVLSLDAVKLLRRRGYDARRTDEGLPEWRSKGLPLATGAEPVARLRRSRAKQTSIEHR